MATTPYMTVMEAQGYFDERLNTEPWDNAVAADQLKALQMATRSINRLRFKGYKTVDSQVNQFPRNGSTEIPVAIQHATCELALRLLDIVDPNLEIENLAVSGDTYSMVKTSFIRDFALPQIRAGIPSSEAWHLLLPYLADPQALRLIRQ